jgi:hypothetical protein
MLNRHSPNLEAIMNDETLRKRSPRAPSIPLSSAIERALQIYEAEGRHQAPAAAVAQDIGYKSASSGAAKTMLASIRYYGLLDRPKEGVLAVSKSVEEFKFAPNDSMKKEILERWLRSPDIFADLLEKYPTSLPSQATLKFDLIQRGFSSAAADDCMACFIDSVTFVRTFNAGNIPAATESRQDEQGQNQQELREVDTSLQSVQSQAAPNSAPIPSGDNAAYDQIPVRLTGGRKAWLTIPSVFYSGDKQRLISQIELLLTEDEDQ